MDRVFILILGTRAATILPSIFGHALTLVRKLRRSTGNSDDWRPGLKEYLETSIPGPKCIYDDFQWPQINSTRSRAKAASELRCYLEKIHKRHPDAKVYLIAHSHGGTLAAYGLRDIPPNFNIKGLICLATPFLIASRRDLGGQGPSYIAMMLALMGWYLYRWKVENIPLGEVVSLKAALPFLILVSAAIVLVAYLLKSKPVRWLENLKLPDLREIRLLNVRACGDEAAAGLSFARTLGAMVGVPWARISKFMSRYAKLSAILTIPLALAASLYARLSPEVSLRKYFLILGPPMIFPLLIILLVFLAVPLCIVTGLALYLVGKDSFLYGLIFDVTCEPAPPGSSQMYVIPACDAEITSEKLGGLMAHSIPCYDEGAFQKISDWVLADQIHSEEAPYE